MSDNIIKFPGQTMVDLPADQVLEAAKDEEFDSMVVMGMTVEGNIYIAGTTSDMATVTLLHRRMGIWIDNALSEFDA